jgi:Flp pilus assembly protein TadG
MPLIRRRTARRRGLTLVESALVLGIFLVLLFGIFEYCRFLLVLHVTTNAARDGARYAGVNGDKPATFNTTDYTDGLGNTSPSVVGYTTARMGGVQNQIQGFAVAVYPVDPTGLTLSPPVVRSASLNPPAYPDPFNPDSNSPAWNATVFPNRLAVTIKGTYQPILPTLLLMPSSIPIYVTAMMGME